MPSLLGIDLGSFSQLRMLRAFRVFRLFKRIKSLNKIIVSLANAVPGLINAAIVQFLVMCIYAILAVDLFRDFGKDLSYVNFANETVPLVTSRGLAYGEEYYGNFFRSLYTLFQVLTGESWSEAVARPIIMESGVNQYVGGIYFVSYIIICGIILVNVSVAVLLEKMVSSPEEEEEEDLPTGINLAELPPHLVAILSPLDLDGDGFLTTSELHQAADLLQREKHGGWAPAPASEQENSLMAQRIADLVAAQMVGHSGGVAGPRVALGGPEPDQAGGRAGGAGMTMLDELREEGRRREAMLRQHIEEAKLRAETAEQQLAALVHSAQVTQQAILRAKARSRQRMGGRPSMKGQGACTPGSGGAEGGKGAARASHGGPRWRRRGVCVGGCAPQGFQGAAR